MGKTEANNSGPARCLPLAHLLLSSGDLETAQPAPDSTSPRTRHSPSVMARLAATAQTRRDTQAKITSAVLRANRAARTYSPGRPGGPRAGRGGHRRLSVRELRLSGAPPAGHGATSEQTPGARDEYPNQTKATLNMRQIDMTLRPNQWPRTHTSPHT